MQSQSMELGLENKNHRSDTTATNTGNFLKYLECRGDVSSLSSSDDNYYYVTARSRSSDGKVLLTNNGSSLTDWQTCQELESNNISHIASGRNVHMGLTSSGKVFTWFHKGQNQCGENNELPEMSPPRLMNLSNKVVEISCGANHTVFLTEESRVGVWGSNSEGQLGLGNTAKAHYSEPQFVECLKGVPFIQVVAGGYHSLALTATSVVFGWGRNTMGQLGVKKKDKHSVPTWCKDVRSKSIQYICCGENHTAMLSKDGRVFSFGLDFGDGLDDSSPALLNAEIQGLKGKHVSTIACASQSTIAYVPASDEVFVYGKERRQIKLREFLIQNGHASYESDEQSTSIISLYTSNDCTFIHVGDAQDRKGGPKVMDKMLSLDRIQNEFPREVSKQYLKQQLKPSLATAACLNGSFLLSTRIHEECNRLSHGVDMDRVKSFFEFLRAQSLNNKTFSGAATEALKALLLKLDEPANVVSLRLYLMLPSCHLMEDIQMHDVITGPFANAVRALDEVSLKILDSWLKTLHLTHFKRYLQVFKKIVCKLLFKFKETYEKSKIQTLTSTLQACIWLMNKLYNVNETRSNKLSYKKFYVSGLLSNVNIHGDFIASLKDAEKKQNEMFRFCKYPFLYNPECKSLLLKHHNMMTMLDTEISHPFSRDPYSLLSGVILNDIKTMSVDDKLFRAALKNQTGVIPVLTVKRESIVEDSRNQLYIRRSIDVNMHRREFEVMFDEAAAVGQGVYQEYFTVLFHELCNTSGIFVEEEESNLLWFRSQNENNSKLFGFAGYMLGITLFNSKLLDVRFPLALYKKLMDEPVTYEDFEELKPEYSKSIKDILEMEGVENLELYFVVGILAHSDYVVLFK